MEIGQRIKERRLALGMTQAELADLLETTERQVSRWESATPRTAQEPAASNCVRLAHALNLSLDELLGVTAIGMDLSGTWYAAWDTTRGGEPVIDRHTIVAQHRGSTLTFAADGDYFWTGDLRLVDGSLMGTYLASDRGGVQRGSLYFRLGKESDTALGRWTGRSVDSIIGTGWGVLARDEARAGDLVDLAIGNDGPPPGWLGED